MARNRNLDRNFSGILNLASHEAFQPAIATELTPQCEKLSDADMIANVKNDLLKSVKGNMPESTRELLPLFELIEKASSTKAPKGGDNAKGKFTQGEEQ
jgi:hypothetical protein